MFDRHQLRNKNIKFNKDKQYYLEVHKQLGEREAELAKTLNEKYGTGTINIETGVID